MIQPIQNKVGAFLADPHLYRVLTRSEKSIDVRKVMDEGMILLVNLAKGKVGGENAALLGALLVSRLGLAALSRADIPEATRRDFFLYLDEFQDFTTLSTATMLSELRKYHLIMVLAHQYLEQLDREVRSAILGNVGTIITFRVGVEDARLLEGIFAPVFNELDLTRLPNHQIYIRPMVKGAPVDPFSAETLPPLRQDA